MPSDSSQTASGSVRTNDGPETLVVGAEQDEQGGDQGQRAAEMPNWAKRRGTSPERSIK